MFSFILLGKLTRRKREVILDTTIPARRALSGSTAARSSTEETGVPFPFCLLGQLTWREREVVVDATIPARHAPARHPESLGRYGKVIGRVVCCLGVVPLVLLGKVHLDSEVIETETTTSPLEDAGNAHDSVVCFAGLWNDSRECVCDVPEATQEHRSSSA